MRQSLLLSLSALLLGSISACGDDASSPNETEPNECATSTVTYANVSAFSDKYCASCHADASLPVCSGECKNHILANEADWKSLGVHALAAVESGSMPLTGARPTAAEISSLSEWVKCNADEHDHGHDHAH